MSILAWILTAVVITTTLLPFVPRDDWWVRAFDFPRLQIALLGVLAGALFYVTGGLDSPMEIVAFAALAGCVLYQTSQIFPYTPFAPKELLPAGNGDRTATVSFIIANVLMENRNAARLLEIVDQWNPDILLLLEPDFTWESDLETLNSRYPNSVRKPLANTYGMLLYSRLPLIDPEIRYLLKTEIPSIRTEVRIGTGQTFYLFCVHPEPPAPTEAPDAAERDAELLVVGKEVDKLDGPAIVCGDLNDVAWSSSTRLFREVSGLLDPRRGRGMFSTFNAKIPVLRWPLDHIFVTEHFRFASMERLPEFGSDHFPVYAKVVLQPEEQEGQEPPDADGEEEARAAKKIEKGKAADR